MKLRTGAIISILLLSCGGVFAGPIDTVTIRWRPPNFTLGTINVWDQERSGECYGGVYQHEISTTQPPTGEGLLLVTNPNTGLLDTFCVELLQDPDTSFVTYQLVMPEDRFGFDRQCALRELWGRFFATARANAAAAEAFSACVWEIVYEDNATVWDVNAIGSADGRGFRATNVDTVLSNSWLASLDGLGPKADLRVLINPDRQDYLAEVHVGGGDVPEPATLVLFLAGGGLIRLAHIARRRK